MFVYFYEIWTTFWILRHILKETVHSLLIMSENTKRRTRQIIMNNWVVNDYLIKFGYISFFCIPIIFSEVTWRNFSILSYISHENGKLAEKRWWHATVLFSRLSTSMELNIPSQRFANHLRSSSDCSRTDKLLFVSTNAIIFAKSGVTFSSITFWQLALKYLN